MEWVNWFYCVFDVGVDMVEWLVCEEFIDCSFVCYGKFKLVVKFEYVDKLVCSQVLLVVNVDVDMCLIICVELCDELGSDCYYGGLLMEKSVGMYVGCYVCGLVYVVQWCGVIYFEYIFVLGLKV